MGILNIFGTFTKTNPQNANVPNYKISPIPSRGDVVYSTGLSINNLDKNVGELITSIRCGIGGDLVVEGPAGDLMFYLGLLDGQTIYGKFAAVLSSGVTRDGVTITTNANNITWYGGES